MSYKRPKRKHYEQPPPSPIEISFWEAAKPLIPELQREVWVSDKYRADFLIPSQKVIVELYGYEYHKTKQKITRDAERERYLQRLGYEVVRFTGSEIFKDVHKCVYEVLSLPKVQYAIKKNRIHQSGSLGFKDEDNKQLPKENVPSSNINLGNSLNRSPEISENKVGYPPIQPGGQASQIPEPFGKKGMKVLGMEIWQLIVICVLVITIVCILSIFVFMLLQAKAS